MVLSDASVGEMVRLAKSHHPNEVGTSLVGRYSDDGFTAYVESTAPLPPDSRGSRMAFSRGVGGLKEFFKGLATASGIHPHYVGEWHTHPGGAPRPSYQDDNTQRAIARDPKTRCPEVVLVIIGGDLLTKPTVGVFVYSRHHGRVDLLPAEF